MSIKEFKEKGYTVVKNAISKDLADFVTQYTLFDEIKNFDADTIMVPGAHAKYADPAIETLLVTLQPLVEKHTGKKIEPTYSFFRVYRPGNELFPHTDRPSCEFSVTLSLGYDYKEARYKWPIFIKGTPIVLEPGDMVCYKGVELEHWREKFAAPEESWHSQAFLHYVDMEGPYAYCKYDGRESLGLPLSSSSLYSPMTPNQVNTLKPSSADAVKPSYIEYTR